MNALPEVLIAGYAIVVTGLLVYRWKAWGYYKTRFDSQRKTLDSYATNEEALRERQMESMKQSQAAFYAQNDQVVELNKWLRKHYTESELVGHTWLEFVKRKLEDGRAYAALKDGIERPGGGK